VCGVVIGRREGGVAGRGTNDGGQAGRYRYSKGKSKEARFQNSINESNNRN